ncbi:hypothetical protein [Erythrobacter sp. WG]|uniref:hypothetical protein n=1 Tax=Erythrobacter sp. WG TaxID=2985510 RepID=UPI00226E774A|nr:hypothetical protein [Erythrobacter sp. WG]MCX9146587.1 hypothetical protein [Erythrobacter sp. WG]
MMPRFASKAEYYRHHRKVFLLALELGVTPIEAEARMKAVQVREEHRAKMARGRLRRSALPPLSLTGEPVREPSFTDFDARWMMRN